MSLCGMPYEDGDGACDLWSEKKVTTRKSHKCCECFVEIPIGEKCGMSKGLYEGSWFKEYRCAACLILAELAATIEGLCPLWGGLDDFIVNINWMEEHNLPTASQHRKKWESIGEKP